VFALISSILKFFKSPYQSSLTINLAAFVFASARYYHAELEEWASYVVASLLFQSIITVKCVPPFALMQRVESKDQGKPEPLRASCRPRTASLRFFL
jgi:hypothetical protein